MILIGEYMALALNILLLISSVTMGNEEQSAFLFDPTGVQQVVVWSNSWRLSALIFSVYYYGL